jgi:hypothetical protein
MEHEEDGLRKMKLTASQRWKIRTELRVKPLMAGDVANPAWEIALSMLQLG